MPGPLPLPPALIPIHAALGVAVHAQPAATVTVTVPVPPLLSIVPLPGAIANEQTGVGSVGELSPQLTSVIDNNPASDAHVTNLAFMTHLPRGRDDQLAPPVDIGPPRNLYGIPTHNSGRIE